MLAAWMQVEAQCRGKLPVYLHSAPACAKGLGQEGGGAMGRGQRGKGGGGEGHVMRLLSLGCTRLRRDRGYDIHR